MAVTFKDSSDREWRVDITCAHAMRIERELKIDLSTVEGLKSCFSSPLRAGSILGIVLESQMKDECVTPEELAEALNAESLGNAIEALEEGLILFCQPGKVGRKIVESLPRQREEMLRKVENHLNQGG